MTCPKCGTLVSSGDKFCSGCGTIVEQKEVSSIIEPEIDIKEVLFKSYVGKNYDALFNRLYSTNAFIFGVFYLLYRKLYLMAFSWLFIIFLLSLFLSVEVIGIIGFVFSVVITLSFKKLYIKDVRSKVEKIINENVGKTTAELVMIATDKGGTNLGLPIIVGVVYFIFVFVSTLSLLIPKANSTIGNLSLYIPEAWEEIETNTYQQANTNCSINITSGSKVYSSEEYADTFTNVVNSASGNIIERKDKTIDGHKWVYVLAKYDGALYYTYFSENGDDSYSILYEIKDETDLVCRENIIYIENSLSFK